MITITELLILESEDQKPKTSYNININVIIERSLKILVEGIKPYNLRYDFSNIEVQKLFMTYFIIELCEEKKKNINNTIVYTLEHLNYCSEIVDLLNKILQNLCLHKDKGDNFFANFRRYLKKHHLKYLANSYFKQTSNKLALLK